MLYLNPEIAHDEGKVIDVAEHIGRVKLSDFIIDTKIFLEEYGSPSHKAFKYEAKTIAEFDKKNPTLAKFRTNLSNWVIRFNLNHYKLIHKNITLENIVEKFYLKHDNVFLVNSSEFSSETILRIYIKESEFCASI